MILYTKKVNIGFFLLCSGLILSFGIFSLSVPGVGMGIWPQSELAVTAFHFSSLLCLAGLGVIRRKNNVLIHAIFSNPLVFIPFLIGFWSLLITPLQDLPVRHILGAPQNGEGVIFWIDWSVLTASVMVIWQTRIWPKVIAVIATLAFIGMTALTFAHVYFQINITPYYFTDYLAINLFLLAGTLIVTFHLKIQKISVPTAIGIILFYGLLYFTQNNIAIAFGVLGILFFIVAERVLKTCPRFKNMVFRAVLIVLPLLTIAGIWGLYLLMDGQGFYDFEKITYVRNILSRSYLVWIGLQPIFETPFMALTGTGWGTFTEHAVQHLPIDWFDFTKDRDQWEGISWDQFHTHHMFVDMFFSTGIIGLFLFCALFILAPSSLKERYKTLGFIVLSFITFYISFWFLFPLNVPYIAMALGAIGCIRISGRKKYKFARHATWILPVVMILQIYAVIVHLRTVISTYRYDAQLLTVEAIQEKCPMDYYDGGAGGLHLSRILVARARQAVGLSQKEGVDIEELHDVLGRLNHIYCQADQYAQTHIESKRLKVARLIARGEILLGITDLSPEHQAYYYEGWKDSLIVWLHEMPKRTDQAVPFLLWHLTNQEDRKIYEIADIIYKNNPKDPVGLWFTGIVMITDTDTVNDGLQRMREALKNGIERFMPIDEQTKKNLMR